MTKLILFSLFLFTSAWADELIKIEAISKSRKTFVTRNIRNTYANTGMQAAFITDELSFTARAITVTREYIQWQVVLPSLQLPLKKDDFITFSKNEEKVSTRKVAKNFSVEQEQEDQDLLFGLNSSDHINNKEEALHKAYSHSSDPKLEHKKWHQYVDEMRAKKYQDMTVAESQNIPVEPDNELLEEYTNLGTGSKKVITPARHFLFYRYGSSNSRSLNISGADQTGLQSKAGLQEFSYYFKVVPFLSLGLGRRTDVEIYNDDLGYKVQRTFYFGQIGMHYQMNDDYEFYGMLLAGSGASSGQNSAVTQSGKALLLPGIKLGLNWSISENLRISLEGGSESIQTKDTLPDGTSQLTTQNNTTLSIGFGFAI